MISSSNYWSPTYWQNSTLITIYERHVWSDSKYCTFCCLLEHPFTLFQGKLWKQNSCLVKLNGPTKAIAFNIDMNEISILHKKPIVDIHTCPWDILVFLLRSSLLRLINGFCLPQLLFLITMEKFEWLFNYLGYALRLRIYSVWFYVCWKSSKKKKLWKRTHNKNDNKFNG